MEDADILKLYFNREERAIAETQAKYGRQIYAVAYRILCNREDAQECENDTYLGAWNTIPPEQPTHFPAYLVKLARNISISRYRAGHAQKRGGGEIMLSLGELEECLPAPQELTSDSERLASAINDFLSSLTSAERGVFLCRYWRCDAITDIARQFGYGQSKVKMMLKRTRDRLRNHLEQEGLL